MNFQESQKDMRLAYLGGGAGVLASGLIWIITGVLAIYTTKFTSILVFFFGGMLIHPMGIIISKLFNRTGKHASKNYLSTLALESTALLFIGLFIAYSVFQINTAWFFPIMLMTIGGRYLIFQSIYGVKTYWILGLILILAAAFCLMSSQAFNIPALIGGIIELIFGIIIIQNDRLKEMKI